MLQKIDGIICHRLLPLKIIIFGHERNKRTGVKGKERQGRGFSIN
jgi:hypothetical protein